MRYELTLWLTVCLPMLGSCVLPLVGPRSPRLRNAAAFTLVAAALVGSFLLLPSVLRGQTTVVGLALPQGLGVMFKADGLAVFAAIVSSLISAIVVLYSTDYIRHYDHQDEYYFMVVLFLGSMMGLVFSGNLLLLFVFWEITAITSWRLIGFFREKAYVVKADKAFLVTGFGGVNGVALLAQGFGQVAQQTRLIFNYEDSLCIGITVFHFTAPSLSLLADR
jgi:NADH:ubiquinone oxidoreductase subunit 5 (subunit L)/multisubunit Na+/H+ antiporter MnhA subunit